tara:strand:- start:3391 stop:4101 length:711 start_codon:yes stop_codon:yes gene_type:complete
MQFFYTPNLDESTTECTFDPVESRHIVKVLRKKVGESLYITNGKGLLFEAKISVADGKKCKAEIVSSTKKARNTSSLHMVVAPTKMNDRYEWFLEKATEIGVDEITPIICDRSERRVIKTERMEKVLQTAMKQSLRTYLPQLNEAITFDKFLARPITGQLYIAHCEEDKKVSLTTLLASPNTKTTILIGPEGDFSPNEIRMALEKNYLPISLGESRLRTETAAIVACTIVNMIHNH